MTKQQEVSSGAASLGLLVSMFMSSQLRRTLEKGHPTRFDENNTEAASGNWLNPKRMIAKAKMSNRRIDLQCTKFAATDIQTIIWLLLACRGCELHHQVA